MPSFRLLSVTIVFALASSAQAWTCSGLCGYFTDQGTFEPKLPPTMVMGFGGSAGQAYTDATRKCALADKSATPLLGRPLLEYSAGMYLKFAQNSDARRLEFQSVKDACVKD